MLHPLNSRYFTTFLTDMRHIRSLLIFIIQNLLQLHKYLIHTAAAQHDMKLPALMHDSLYGFKLLYAIPVTVILIFQYNSYSRCTRKDGSYIFFSTNILQNLFRCLSFVHVFSPAALCSKEPIRHCTGPALFHSQASFLQSAFKKFL